MQPTAAEVHCNLGTPVPAKMDEFSEKLRGGGGHFRFKNRLASLEATLKIMANLVLIQLEFWLGVV